jgi:hypothetical protein
MDMPLQGVEEKGKKYLVVKVKFVLCIKSVKLIKAYKYYLDETPFYSYKNYVSFLVILINKNLF